MLDFKKKEEKMLKNFKQKFEELNKIKKNKN